MKLKTLTAAILVATTLPAQAGFMMGHPGAEAATEVLETVTSYTDETTAATLQSQQDVITDLQTQLEELMAAEEVDQEAVAELRSQLHDARHELRDDIRDIVGDNEELQTALQEQREAAREERRVTGYALHNDEAFASLIDAATEEQATTLEANQTAMEELRTQADELRAAGATREEMQDIREQMRELGQEQAEIVGEVLESNEELQTELSSAASDMVSEMRPRHGGGGRGRE